MTDPDRRVRFAAIAALHEKEALTERDWSRLEASTDRAYLLAALRDPTGTASRAAFDEAEREREGVLAAAEEEIEAAQVAEWAEHRTWLAKHLSGKTEAEFGREVARDRALARGLAANPKASDSVIQILAADGDGEAARRAGAQLEARV